MSKAHLLLYSRLLGVGTRPVTTCQKHVNCLTATRNLRCSKLSAAVNKVNKKKDTPKGKREAKGPAPAVECTVYREDVCAGANILKDGEDPLTKEDSEYPDWLWALADPPEPPIFGSKEYWRKKNKDNIRRANRKKALFG